MRRFTKKQYLVAGDAAAIIAGTAGSAIAYWTNSGSGTGSATTGTNAGITVNQTSPITGLYPGGTAQTLSGNFDNTNAGAVHVASVTTTGVTVDTASAGAGCLAAWLRARWYRSGQRQRSVRCGPGFVEWPDCPPERQRRQPGCLQGRDDHDRLRKQLI